MNHDELCDRLLAWTLGDPRIDGLWIEGSKREEVRRPYLALDAHVAVSEPSFDAVVATLPGVAQESLGASLLATLDVPRFAKAFRFSVGDRDFSVTVERSSLIGKRPRAWVSSLFDRTGKLTYVMDFSLRRTR
jgi:hypothetical protein